METGQGKRSGCSSKPARKDGKDTKAKTAEEEAKRREALKETLMDKLELEQRARQVVERLLDDSVTEDFLIDCARLITSVNYKDTVEERSIAKLCGYPVCPKKLGNVPRQQYKISTKTNKVYDITERKCFCSNFCYKASKCFELQISKTPLWLRNEERPTDVTLMTEEYGLCRGSSGLEVKLADQPVAEADIENPVLEAPEPHGHPPAAGESDSSDAEQDFVSSVVSQRRAGPRVHWGKLPKRGGGSEAEERRGAEGRGCNGSAGPPQGAASENHGDTLRSSQTLSPGGELSDRPSSLARDAPVECAETRDASVGRAVAETGELLSQCGLKDGDTPAAPAQGAPVRGRPGGDGETPAPAPHGSDLNITQVGVSKRGAAGLQGLLRGRGARASQPPSVRLALLERLRLTLAEWRTEETLKFLYGPDCVSERQEEEEQLDEDDLEEGVEMTGGSVQPGGAPERPSAPAPDYDTLRQETEMLDLKVREFYRGVCVLPEKAQRRPEVQSGDREDVGGKDPALPLVDSHSQHLIQKRIAVEKLSKSMRNILGPLQLTMSDVASDINHLVRTFRFTNTNIIHKSPEWTLFAVVLLSVLTEVSPLLRESLATPSSVEHVSSLMEDLRLNDQDLQSLVLLFRPPRRLEPAPLQLQHHHPALP